MVVLTLDDVRYTAKPDRAEFARLMNRMKAAKPRDVDRREFCEHVAAGKSFIGGAFGCGLKTLDSWQLAALDFDDGSLSPIEALDRCERLDIAPTLLYFTLSSVVEKPRFRLAFDLGQSVHDADVAADVIATLMHEFPEADGKCKNPNRIFLGSNGEVWRCWQVYCP